MTTAAVVGIMFGAYLMSQGVITLWLCGSDDKKKSDRARNLRVIANHPKGDTENAQPATPAHRRPLANQAR